MLKHTLLIIGHIPPPIGGVTIHVQRLMRKCEENGIYFDFYNLKFFKICSFINQFRRAKVVHAHVTNSYFCLLFALLGIFFRKKTILTIHQDLNRYTLFTRLFINFSIRYVTVPILLNKYSFDFSKQLNSSAKNISSFIAPILNDYSLGEEHLNQVLLMKAKFKFVFCTNASNFAFDKFGSEIYCLSLLLDIFKKLKQFGLIISDPSGKNFKEYSDRISNNVMFINSPHSFLGVLNKSDCLIRATTTDGDSLSVKEALYIGKPVICSDCVDRPYGVTLFQTNCREDLIRVIHLISIGSHNYKKNICGFNEIKKLYI